MDNLSKNIKIDNPDEDGKVDKNYELYKLLIENTSDYVSLIDVTGRYIYLSPSHRQLGYVPEELIGRSATEMLHPDDKERLQKKLFDVAKQITGSKLKSFVGIKEELDLMKIDFKWPDNSGNWHNFESTPDIVKNPFGIGYAILLVTKDVTDRKLAVEALRESEEKYRNLIDNMQEGVFIIQDFKVRFANESFARLCGYSVEEVIDKDFRNFIAPEDLKIVAYRYLKRLAGFNVPKEYEIRLMHIDGKTKITVNLNVGIIKYDGRDATMGTAKDITDKKRSEAEKEKLLKAISTCTEGIAITDENDRYIYTNAAFAGIYGYSQKELIGKTWKDNNQQEMIGHGEKITHETFQENDNGSFNGELSAIRKDGTKLPIDMRATALPDEKGKYMGHVCVVRDITERKVAEEVHIENVRLSHASTAKSEFLANMSHELRTPLNSIIGFSELMKLKISGDLNAKQEKYLENVLTSSKHLLNIINDILDLSKVESGKIELNIEKISVPDLIDECLILIKERTTINKIKVKKKLDTSLLFIEADKLRLKQVLFNLLSNASKFIKPEGCTITIRTINDGNMARFQVSDTGIGIRENDICHLFKDFEQIDSGLTRNYEGTGLGLAISKRLVELHGGTITVESRYGEGSTFTFAIPIRAKKIE